MSRSLSSAAQRWILALGLVLACSNAGAAYTSAVSASTGMGTWFTYALPDLYNGDGLSAPSLGATHSADFTTMWLSDYALPPGNIVFDLGDIHSVSQIAIWNYNWLGNSVGNLDRGVQEFSVDVSANGITYSPARGTSTLAKASGTDGETAQLFSLANAGEVRYVRLNLLSNYGAEGYVGLSEVHFDAVRVVAVPTPVPTLSDWGLVFLALLLASAALGFLRRRRAVS